MQQNVVRLCQRSGGEKTYRYAAYQQCWRAMTSSENPHKAKRSEGK